MTDKQDLREALLQGCTAARKSGFTSNSLGPTKTKAAKSNFERWYAMEVEE